MYENKTESEKTDRNGYYGCGCLYFESPFHTASDQPGTDFCLYIGFLSVYCALEIAW